ncbi:MAG: NADH-quinone oxidoreductase subunit J [Bacteroidota bacterium]
MSLIEILFYVFAGLAVISASLILITKNVLYAAFALIVTFLCVAAIYVFAGAEFIAVTQIMVYVGGILVLMIFGVMLTHKLTGKDVVTLSHNRFVGYLLGIVLFGILFFNIININAGTIKWISESQATSTQSSDVNNLGISLMSDYILPFEIAGILLLVALIGAALIAGTGKKI